MRSLLVAAALAGLSARAHAQNPLEKPAFTATPKELLDAAKHAPGDGAVLRTDVDLSFDAAGKLTKRFHLILFVSSAEQAEDWNELWTEWRPWRHEKPHVRARVIAASGEVHELDASTVVEETDRVGEGRHLRAPLVVDAGSIIEQESTIVDVAGEPGGRAVTAGSGWNIPVISAHVTISAPVALKAKVVARALPKSGSVKHAVSGGRETWTCDLANLPAQQDVYDAPFDAFTGPQLTVSLAHDWSDIAKAYAALVEPKLTLALPPELHAGDSIEVAQAITSWVHQHVKYSGANLVQTAPDAANLEQAIKRGSGSTNELALLETALLRAAGIKAELVLVDRGPGRSGDLDAPSFDEMDHVLVRATIRGVETWIDPEDMDLPVGQLRADDQGRPALAVTHAARIETPRAPAASNTLRETRTFELAQLGVGKVTEASVETGDLAYSRRGWLRDRGEAAARKQFAGYLKERYGGEPTTFTFTPLDEPSKPLALTLGVDQAPYIDTGWQRISLQLHPYDVCEDLPWSLRDEKAPDRTVEVDIARPYIDELTNRIIVPDGFVLPVPVPERKRQLGALMLVETQRLDGRTFVVTYRLELAKTRLTAADATETRKAVVALLKETEPLVFEHEGWVLARKGAYRDAVAKMKALIAAHPQSGLMHARFAQLLITLGDGEGARREGRKGVELAPKDADAHVALGWVLTHDLTGRRWEVGFDREGARKELVLAHSLGPKHAGAASELAMLLERGRRGAMLGPGADLRAAAEAWRAAYELDPKKTNAQGLFRTLLWSGDVAGVEAAALKMKASDDRDAMLLAARAILHGADAALHDLATSDRSKTVQAAGALLMLVRQYDLARRMFDESGLPAGAQREIIDKLKRFDPAARPSGDPDAIAFEMFNDAIDPGSAGAIYWDKQTGTEIGDAMRDMPLPPFVQLMSPPLMMDILHAIGTATVEGDANAWRVELSFSGHTEAVYLAADRGVPKVIGLPTAYHGIGRHVARLMGKHDDAARRLLDWLAKDLPRNEMHYVWGDPLPKDTVHMTVAAALLAHDADRDIAAGTACGMTTVEGQRVCDRIAARGFEVRGKWAELEAYAAAWIARAPAAYVDDALEQRVIALAHLGRFDEAESVLDDALAKTPDSIHLMMVRATLAGMQGHGEEIAKRAQAVVQAAPANALLLNNVAWLDYISNVEPVASLDRARKAFELDSKAGFIANTLAATEQVNGDEKSALEHVRSSIDLRHGDAPGDSDWYVLGRIYEDIGLGDDAVAAYRRIPAPKVPDVLPTPYSMAATRLKTLGASKK